MESEMTASEPKVELNAAGKPGPVSVAMCTYNGAGFLSEQLDSILRQTELPEELVVCDDDSTDETVPLLEAFARSAPFRVEIHRNQSRLGYAQNFAKCIGLCRGDLIVLTDQDDVWFPDRIQETRATFATNPDIAFTFSDAPLIDDNGRDLGRTVYENLPLMRQDRRRLRDGTSVLPMILRWGGVYGCTMAFRSSFLPIILPVPETWSHDVWISLVLSAIGPSARIKPVTKYRQHSSQFVGSGRRTIKTKLVQARARQAEQYQWEIRHYELGLNAARLHAELQGFLVSALESRIEFVYKRRGVQSGGARGLRSLAQLLRAGDYWNLGGGLPSLLKDVATMFGCFRDGASQHE